MVGFPAVEHRHSCVYCEALWFCHDDCPLSGPSVCEDCRPKIAEAPPGTPYRVIHLDRASRILRQLSEYEAARLARELKRRDFPQ